MCGALTWSQALLLRWLIMVYDILEGYHALSQLYGLLFNCLYMITLRSVSQALEGVCANLLTEPIHVTFCRY